MTVRASGGFRGAEGALASFFLNMGAAATSMAISPPPFNQPPSFKNPGSATGHSNLLVCGNACHDMNVDNMTPV